MNKTFKNESLKILAVLAVTMFTACGDKMTNVTESGMNLLAKGEALPECSEENSGKKIYAADSGMVYFCSEDGWLSIRGADGVDGKDGENFTDTVVVLNRDSVILSVTDSVLLKETLFLQDSVILWDTLVIQDSLVGLDGESCIVEILGDASGYKMMCGGDSVGVVLNGLKGEKGYDGADGNQGSMGASGSDAEECFLSDDGAGTVTMTCGSETTKLYKALCGTEPYDPEKRLCDSRDNQLYWLTIIGTQTWMAENLNYNYNSGSAVSYCYESSADSCAKYGRLYTWSAAMDSAAVYSTNGQGCGYGVECSPSGTIRGVCPGGFHLPTDTEWITLAGYVAANNDEEGIGKILKTAFGWNNNGNGTDVFDFSALPAGVRSPEGNFINAGNNALFWSASEFNTSMAIGRNLLYSEDDLYASSYIKGNAFSIRCLKDY